MQLIVMVRSLRWAEYPLSFLMLFGKREESSFRSAGQRDLGWALGMDITKSYYDDLCSYVDS